MSNQILTFTSEQGHLQEPNGTQDFIVPLTQPLRLVGAHEVALVNLNTQYAWNNIAARYNNNTFSYFLNRERYDVVIEDGVYSFATLATYIHNVIRVNEGQPINSGAAAGLSLDAVIQTSRIIIHVRPGYQFLFPATSNFYRIFGFDPGLYPPSISTEITTFTGVRRPDVANNLTNLQIHTSLVSNGIVGRQGGSTLLFSFGVPSGATPGNNFAFTPQERLYVPVDSNLISSIRFTLTDQLGDTNTVFLAGAPLTVTIAIRKIARL